MSEAQLRAAQDALQQGDVETARTILEDLITANERDVEAWLMLSQVVADREEREICLENVLALDSNNAEARMALESLRSGGSGEIAGSFGDDPFAAVEQEFDAAFGLADEDDDLADFDLDSAFDVEVPSGEVTSRLDRMASNRRLMTLLMLLFGVGFLGMIVLSILLLTWAI